MILFIFVLTSLVSSSAVILDDQINDFLTKEGRTILSVKTEQSSRFKSTNTKFYITDQEMVKVSNVGNYFFVGYPVFLIWPNSDFLYFILSYYLANFNPYYIEEQKPFRYLTNYKFLFDIEGDFSLEPYYKDGGIISKSINFYRDIDELDTEILSISQKNMRNIFNFKEMFAKKDKTLTDFIGSSKLAKEVAQKPSYIINNLNINLSFNRYSRIDRFDSRYMDDLDIYNKVRNLDDEDKFNIARAKILGFYTDKKEFLTEEENKYFDHRLDGKLPIYIKYFTFYRYIRNKDWGSLLSLVKSEGYLFSEYLSFALYKASKAEGIVDINQGDFKKVSEILYYNYLIRSKNIKDTDIQNLKNSQMIQEDVKFYLLTQVYALSAEYNCDYLLNTIKINFLFLNRNDRDYYICDLYTKVKNCSISSFESRQLLKDVEKNCYSIQD